jgi:hypothetical protein
VFQEPANLDVIDPSYLIKLDAGLFLKFSEPHLDYGAGYIIIVWVKKAR